jgi:hypothetical protein
LPCRNLHIFMYDSNAVYKDDYCGWRMGLLVCYRDFIIKG